MALEAVVFPKEHLVCTVKARSASLGCGFHTEELEDKGGEVLQGEAADALLPPGADAGAGTMWEWDAVLCPCSTAPGAVEECWDVQHQLSVSPPPPAVPSAVAASSSGRGKAAAASARRRRRRPKAVKNTEEMESQRRNHIAVERNRRRQMNEYLSVLRSAMPPSYAQRVRTYNNLLPWLHHSSCARSVAYRRSPTGSIVLAARALQVMSPCHACARTAALLIAAVPATFTVTDVKSCCPPGVAIRCCIGPRRAMPLWLHMSRNL